LIENKKDWMEQNFSLIYQTSFGNISLLKLQNFCMELMTKEPVKILNSTDFISISETCLISLIKQNNLQMDDIKIWEHVLKWGIAQNPDLPLDPSDYSKHDFITLKITLQQLIPLINFLELNPKEFLDKVYPYKKVIPKDLREDLIKHFIGHDYKPIKPIDNSEPKITQEISGVSSKNIDSRIITMQHAELISKWIDKSEIADKTYEFKLILRGSRDGFSPNKFHEICDNISHTVSVIKVKNSTEILGGYNPIIWKSERNIGTTKDSFIFSFMDRYNIKKYIMSRIKNTRYAIFNNINYGPSFGFKDLTINGKDFYNKSYCGNSDYERPIRETDDIFSVEEYEIFQIENFDQHIED
jgi:hypothetical protein